MKKRVLLIDTTSTDIDEETQCKNWKSMLDNFSSYEIRFIAALEPNTDMPIVKYVYLRNSTIYAPDSFFKVVKEKFFRYKNTILLARKNKSLN